MVTHSYTSRTNNNESWLQTGPTIVYTTWYSPPEIQRPVGGPEFWIFQPHQDKTHVRKGYIICIWVYGPYILYTPFFTYDIPPSLYFICPLLTYYNHKPSSLHIIYPLPYTLYTIPNILYAPFLQYDITFSLPIICSPLT